MTFGRRLRFERRGPRVRFARLSPADRSVKIALDGSGKAKDHAVIQVTDTGTFLSGVIRPTTSSTRPYSLAWMAVK